VTETEEKKKY